MSTRKETELYQPIKDFLEGQGYEVKGEVRDCDLVAVRNEELVIVELKTRFNLTLVLQGIERQKMTDLVYLAVEAPKKRKSGGHGWKEIQGLCRRLGLGLLVVSFLQKNPRVEAILDPGPYRPQKAKKKRKLLLKEFQHRTGDFNTGGSRKRKIVTAYREKSLVIASYLQKNGPCQLKELREVTQFEKIASIMQKNFYGWFERVERGVYQLTPNGEQALEVYSDVVEQRQSEAK